MNYGIQTEFMNEVLNNYFSGGSNYNIYLGLGLSNDGGQINTDDFIEPSEEAGYSKQPFVCESARDGITSNSNEIVFDTATADWTVNGKVIDKVGLFNKQIVTNSQGIQTENYILWCVLPLTPAETVIEGDTVIINANAIRLQLTNK